MNNKKNASFYFEVASGVWGIRDNSVNMYMIQAGQDWVLVDAGLSTSLSKIKKVASLLFGNQPPRAIILTHAHFDNIGSLEELLLEWNVPVYHHYLEQPYIIGDLNYYPDNLAYSFSPVDFDGYAVPLPRYGAIPVLKEWKYIHTPGHTPGHISLFRKTDRTLIAGDALVTTTQELVTKEMINASSSAYFIFDEEAAKENINKLKLLHPRVIATSHGFPLSGSTMWNEVEKNYYALEKSIPMPKSYINEYAMLPSSLHLPAASAEENGLKNWMAVGAFAGLIVSSSFIR